MLFPPDENGNIIKADHIGINTKDSVIYGNSRLIATVGVEGLIVVETDDAVLVCRKDRAHICGRLNFDPENKINSAEIERMANRLSHHSPDDQGFFGGNIG